MLIRRCMIQHMPSIRNLCSQADTEYIQPLTWRNRNCFRTFLIRNLSFRKTQVITEYTIYRVRPYAQIMRQDWLRLLSEAERRNMTVICLTGRIRHTDSREVQLNLFWCTHRTLQQGICRMKLQMILICRVDQKMQMIHTEDLSHLRKHSVIPQMFLPGK